MIPRDPLLRIFRDYFGREWEVRALADERADARRRGVSNPALTAGSLLFDSGQECRHLCPLPPGWYIAPDEVLSRWCEHAARLAFPASDRAS